MIPLRPLLALSALVALAQPMVWGWGFGYSHANMLWTAGAFLLALAACGCRDRQFRVPGPLHRMPEAPLAVAALLLSGEAAVGAEVAFQANAVAAEVMKAAAVVGFLVMASFWRTQKGAGGGGRVPGGLQVLLLFLAGAVVRVCAVLGDPQPPFDVYISMQEATLYFLRGGNPYVALARWHHALAPPRFTPLPFYPPLPLLMTFLLGRAGLNFRYGNVLCDLLGALVLLKTGEARGRPFAGALAAGIFLLFPGAHFVTELGFYEPLLIALLGTGLYLVERDRRLGYFLVGLGLTGKQFGAVMMLPLLKAQHRRWPALLGGIGLAVVLVILPFFLWGPQDFLNVVFFQHLRQPNRDLSLNLHAWAYRQVGLVLPMPLLWGTGLVLIGWITWRTPEAGTAAALWMGTALFTFIMCNYQGHPNYYYLCAYLLLLGLVGLMPGEKSPEAESPLGGRS